MKKLKILVVPAVAAAIVVLLLAQMRRPKFFNSGYREMMGTFTQITVAAKNRQQAQQLFERAFGRMQEVRRLMNDRDPNSELSKLSVIAAGRPADVSPELFDVLSASLYYSRLTDGAFDVTVGPLTQLWRKTAQTGLLPAAEVVAAARDKVGYKKVRLDPAAKTVVLLQDGMKLDLGGIAKGYAVDMAVDAMRQGGASAGMVDLGGNIRCFGPGPAAGAWLVGVQNPRNDEKIITTLRINDMAAATSGDYRRVAIVNGKHYSHIIDPATGRSAELLAAATVISPSAMQADALSTAVSVVGAEHGLSLLESIDGAEGIMTVANGKDKTVYTSGAEKFISRGK